jgi:DNA replication protein DnaC
VVPTNVLELDSVNLKEVLDIKVVFSRMMDLISKLTNAFRELPFDDNYNMYQNLSDNIEFIFGPPGTGKTTEISKTVLKKYGKVLIKE